MGELNHLALIMDGNGRWATMRSLPRSEGHREGVNAAVKVATAASERMIRFLTLFCFSTENWKRPKGEVDFLMGLFSSQFDRYIDRLGEKNIRILHLGRKDRLPDSVLSRIEKAIEATKNLDGMTLQLAIDYGGEDEIERSIKKAIENGETDFSVPTLSRYVDNPFVPNPDFICRSGGEKRLSGFLQMQSSYAEIGFYDRLWPDWDGSMVDKLIADFSSRERRFGGLK